MSAGEGIFYGLIFIGLIYLYLQTKDRWSWKKIVLWFFGSTVAIIAVIAIYLFIADKISTHRSEDSSKPKVISALIGVSIGEKVLDVQFRTGAKQKNKGSEDSYDFPGDAGKYFRGDKDGLVSRIGSWCSEDQIKYPISYSFEVNGIKCGDTSSAILDKYGKQNIRISCLLKSVGDLDSTTTRAYDAVDFGVRYILLTNKVNAVVIFKPEDLKASIGERWGECK